MLIASGQDFVNNVVLALIGVFHRFKVLLIVLLTDVDDRAILRSWKADIGKNSIVYDLVDRECAIRDLVIAVDRKQHLLRFLFYCGVAALLRVLGYPHGFGFDSIFKQLEIAAFDNDELIGNRHVPTIDVEDEELVSVGKNADRSALVRLQRRDDADCAIGFSMEGFGIGYNKIRDLPSFGKTKGGPHLWYCRDGINFICVVAIEIAKQRTAFNSGDCVK